MKRIEPGDRAPDFKARTHDGQQCSLEALRGKSSVVLFFYPKDETSVCTKEACGFRDAFAEFRAANAVVYGISGDSAESHGRFAKHHALPYPLLVDPDGTLRRSFAMHKILGLLNRRATYVIDAEGIVRHVCRKQLSADAHVQEALRVVRELHSR